MASPKLVTVVGQGYVGLPLAVEAARAGHFVTGFDVDWKKISSLLTGQSYIEDITNADLAALSHYTPTDDPDQALNWFDVVVITVPTPLKDGLPDLSFVEDAARTIAPYLRTDQDRPQTVILESTTHPGTTEEVLIPLLEEGSGLKAGHDFAVGFSPERIDPGNQTFTFRTTTKVVSGIDEMSLKRVREFYESIVDDVFPVQDVKSAEMAKLIENTFRHVNIALVNELAALAHGLGVDIWEALDAAASKPFGFMKFTPGPGVGGHCLPIDPIYLSHRVERTLGKAFRFVELAHDINEHQPDYVVQRLIAGLNQRRKAVNGSRVLVFGLAYKKNTADMRETPATRVIELLVQLGAEVTVVDPFIEAEDHAGAAVFPAIHGTALSEFDAAVVITDHDDFDYETIAINSDYVLDTRHVTDSTYSSVEFI